MGVTALAPASTAAAAVAGAVSRGAAAGAASRAAAAGAAGAAGPTCADLSVAFRRVLRVARLYRDHLPAASAPGPPLRVLLPHAAVPLVHLLRCTPPGLRSRASTECAVRVVDRGEGGWPGLISKDMAMYKYP